MKSSFSGGEFASGEQPQSAPQTPGTPVTSAETDGAGQAGAARRRFRFPRWMRDPENASRAVFLLGPWAAYLMVEVLNDNSPFNSLTAEQVTLNLVWYYVAFWVARMAIGRNGRAARTAMLVSFFFGLANHYVLTFRGRTIFPCDILCIRTAINVAGDFNYAPDRNIWIAVGILAAYWALLELADRLIRPKRRQKLPKWSVIASCAAIVVYCYVFFFTGMLPEIGIYAQQWKTQANGFLLNFMAALRYSFVSKPAGYSADAVQKIADEEADCGVTSAYAGAQQPTNLIVVMNESFADLPTEFPTLHLTSDPLSFYHSMKKNTVRGTMISPVTGGGTANVEFEYLTGDSLAFLPSSTVAYQLYLYNGTASLVSQANALGYRSIAFHPYLSSGWNRTSVYPWLGFAEQHYQEDVQNPQYVRNYISDSSDYQQLYRITDETDSPVFLFNVTIQNHSSYTQGWNNLKKSVSLSGQSADLGSAITQYFSLIKKSDDAIRELVEHYQSSDERTMIVFFGDHQPPLGNSFFEDLYGKKLDDRSTREVIQQYGVPFFIWANYDIPEKDGLVISTNYLGTLTAELAGFPLTGYEELHAELMKKLPVATTVGFITDDGTVTADESQLPPDTRKLYDEYRLAAYNHLFDEHHQPDGFFG